MEMHYVSKLTWLSKLPGADKTNYLFSKLSYALYKFQSQNTKLKSDVIYIIMLS